MTNPVGDLLLSWWADPTHEESVVYFVRNPSNRLVKIGHTRNLPARLAAFRTAIPDLELIGTIKGGVRVEADLHATFAAERVSGEWFMPTVPMATTIAGLVSASRKQVSA